MSKTSFANPYDEFDKDFVNWVVDIMKDVDDPYSSYDDSLPYVDDFDYSMFSSIHKEFDNDAD